MDALSPAEELERVRRELAREFGGRTGQATIDRAAAEALSKFEGARISAFVPLLATREARQRLRLQLPS